MKNIKLLSILCVLFIALCGCSSSEIKTDSPKATVTSLFDLVKEGKYNDLEKVADNVKEYYNLSNDKDAKPINDILIKAVGKIKFTINEEKIDGEKATVSVGADYRDIGKVFKETIKEVFVMMKAMESTKKDGLDEEVMAKKIEESMKKKLEGNLEILHSDITINLVKKDGKWLITLDADIAKVITGNLYRR
ncbi:hypothetical protein PV797_08760 [Clostridiaceae bacterium M8S5]|nr:hypothetical protein PV797_08760 [Clostridiaceae bacterium M8S5]